MRLVFMGTPEFAVPTLSALVQQGHDILACYTRPPARQGRGKKEQPSPVHQAAQSFAIPVFTPKSLKKGEALQALLAMPVDAIIVVAYGLILPQLVLDHPRHGCLNLHGSLLPRWRGAAPLHRAVMAGDRETGVMVMKMEAGLDTGPVAMVEHLPLTSAMTTGDVHDQLARLGADLMVRAVAALERGGLTFQPQSQEGVTYARKIDKAETAIDWSEPAEKIRNHIHGLSPFPGAYLSLPDARKPGQPPVRIKILRCDVVKKEHQAAPATVLDDQLTIACGRDALRPVLLQKAGKTPVSLKDFLNGMKIVPGMSVEAS
jgi:methionyl-tRNA formyltransferase